MFYGIKIPAAHIEKWPNPVPRLMDYPGFPSFVVNYNRTNDEYPSGHIGYILMYIWAFRDIGYTFASRVGIITLVYTLFILLVLGGHFSNDLIIGGITAYYSYRTIKRK